MHDHHYHYVDLKSWYYQVSIQRDNSHKPTSSIIQHRTNRKRIAKMKLTS